MLITRSDDGYFGLIFVMVFFLLMFIVSKEHCLTEDGQAVAQE